MLEFLETSEATVIPFFKAEVQKGKSNFKASGTYPKGKSPKSVKFFLENYKNSLA